MTQRIDKSLIADENAQLLSDLNEDYQALGNKLVVLDLRVSLVKASHVISGKN